MLGQPNLCIFVSQHSIGLIMKTIIFRLLFLLWGCIAWAQSAQVEIQIFSDEQPLKDVEMEIEGLEVLFVSNAEGKIYLDELEFGNYTFRFDKPNYETYYQEVEIYESKQLIKVELFEDDFLNNLDEVVISGTMKPVSRLESPVSVEVYTSNYFKKNPTPNLYDALQNVNGVRPQLNCNICNTGDIHINGLEGPYTMVLVDGMPIMSSLGTVYGLSGIPNSLIDRIEVIKGPASTLYGSEAVGGLINIITKNPLQAPTLSVDAMTTSWLEHNVDVGFKFGIAQKVDVLTGVNYFNYQNVVDKNSDNFTDVALQDRISVFQKWNIRRNESRVLNFATRYLYEDRWGGDVRWNKTYRGGDEIYGESIYTNRWELLGNYELPFAEKLFFGFSFIHHDQDSRYGDTSFIAQQQIAFGQLTWQKTVGKNDLLVGVSTRRTFYDDNTPATANEWGENEPERVWLPGVFVQDEISFNPNHTLLLGLRYDYHNFHGDIFTPRIAYKWIINPNQVLRFNAGNGYRVVNLFTEEHAALTGARKVEILNDLKPEKSYNINVNYTHLITTPNRTLINLDATLFYTYFNNQILPDYNTDPNKIIYDNLDGHAISKGISLNLDINFPNGIKVNAGGTLMENSSTEDGVKKHAMLTENFSGNWAISYKIRKWDLNIDYTGNVYSPMHLPLLSELDPRSPKSPWWSIQNIQFLYQGIRKFEFYGGIKNLLNWTPNKSTPFLIARPEDPFDQNVIFDDNGIAVPTPDNPYGLTFDPSYVYAPNQGIRFFVGFRYLLR